MFRLAGLSAAGRWAAVGRAAAGPHAALLRGRLELAAALRSHVRALTTLSGDDEDEVPPERLLAMARLLAHSQSKAELPALPRMGSKRALITRSRAMAVYLLAPEDIVALPVKLKNAPNFDLRLGLQSRLYPLSAIEKAAITRWGSEAALEAARQALWRQAHRLPPGVVLPAVDDADDRVRDSNLPLAAKRPLTGERAVVTAIAVNVAIAASKVGAYAVTGSGSMFSEMLHSFADVSNQVLLYIGIKRAAREADSQFPYGYGPDRYVWSLISGVGIFFLGCGLSLHHGVSELFHPQAVESVHIAMAVLALSFGLEGYSSSVAIREINREAKLANLSFVNYLRYGSDPMNAAVLMEDLAGLVGVVIAASGIGLASWTGNNSFDAYGSLAVGGLLGVIATYIVQKNRTALIGKSVEPARMHAIRLEMLRDPIISSVHGLRAVEIGADALRVSAEIGFDVREVTRRVLESKDDDGTMLSEKFGASTSGDCINSKLQAVLEEYTQAVLEVLGNEIDLLERRLHKEIPEVRFLELELV